MNGLFVKFFNANDRDLIMEACRLSKNCSCADHGEWWSNDALKEMAANLDL